MLTDEQLEVGSITRHSIPLEQLANHGRVPRVRQATGARLCAPPSPTPTLTLANLNPKPPQPQTQAAQPADACASRTPGEDASTCCGVCYRVGEDDVESVLGNLDFREKGGYTRDVVEVTPVEAGRPNPNLTPTST